MINLDPGILDQESIRKKRRKKMLLYAALPVILLALAGLFFLRPAVFDVLYGLNYNNDSPATIITLGEMQNVANVIEPYIAPYNLGTAYLRDSNGSKAEDALRESLKNLPPADKVCQVRTNLAYSIEIQADEAVIRRNYDNALILYSSAEGILYGDNCASKKDSSSSRDENAKKAQLRISIKRGNAVSAMNGNEDNGGDVDQDNQVQISEEQVEELRDNFINGAEARGGVRDGAFSGGKTSTTEHW